MKWQRGSVTVEGARGRKHYVGRYRAVDGTQPKVRLGFVSELTLTEARTRLEAIVREIGSRPQSSQILTLSEYWRLHYVPRHRVSWSEPTEAGYESYIRAYLGPAFGNSRISDIQPEHIAGFFDRLRKEHSRTVVRKCWVMLNAILADATDNDLILKNPMRKVSYPKTKLPHKPVLESVLLPYVLKAVEDSPRDSAILHVGAFCAMRPAEVFGLRWSSFFGDHFLIRDSAWEGKLLRDQAKVGERRVFIPPTTHAAILRWRAACEDVSPEALLFPSANGTPISAHNFRTRVLVPVREKLGLSVPLTFQVLRRSHATRNQATPKDAQSHLGHKSIVTTMDVYSVEIPESVRRMVTRDEEAILSGRELIAPELHPTRKPQ